MHSAAQEEPVIIHSKDLYKQVIHFDESRWDGEKLPERQQNPDRKNKIKRWDVKAYFTICFLKLQYIEAKFSIEGSLMLFWVSKWV